MRFHSLFLAGLLSRVALAHDEDPWPDFPQDQKACVADNCARAVTGTCPCLIPYHTRRVDCASFALGASATSILTSTVTATTVVATVTKTGTVGVTEIRTDNTQYVTVTTPPPTAKKVKRRDGHRRFATTSGLGALNGVPDYAQVCGDKAHYASACSCWGISANATATASWKAKTTTTVNVTSTKTVYATVRSVVSVIEKTLLSTVNVPAPTSVAKPPSNLLTNPGFELGTKGSHFKPWYHTGGGWAGVASDDESSPGNQATAYNGQRFAGISNFQNGAGPTYLSQDVKGFILSKKYALSFYLQTIDQAQDGCFLWTEVGHEKNLTITRTELFSSEQGDYWTEISANFVANNITGAPGPVTFTVAIDCDKGIGGMWGVDDLSIIQVD